MEYVWQAIAVIIGCTGLPLLLALAMGARRRLLFPGFLSFLYVIAALLGNLPAGLILKFLEHIDVYTRPLGDNPAVIGGVVIGYFFSTTLFIGGVLLIRKIFDKRQRRLLETSSFS